MNRLNRVDAFKKSPRKSSVRRSVGTARFGLVILFLLLIGLPLGCEREIEEPAGREAGATVNEITATPNAYIGKKVTVSGEIKEVYGPKAFTIGPPDASSDELLVVTAKDFPESSDRPDRAEVIEADFVQITGRVQRYIPEKVQEEIGVALDPKVESDYPVSHPVVIAESLHFTAQIRKEAAEGKKAGSEASK